MRNFCVYSLKGSQATTKLLGRSRSRSLSLSLSPSLSLSLSLSFLAALFLELFWRRTIRLDEFRVQRVPWTMGRHHYEQSCVETYQLSFKNPSQNIPLTTPKMHYGAISQPAIPGTWQEYFTRLRKCLLKKGFWVDS